MNKRAALIMVMMLIAVDPVLAQDPGPEYATASTSNVCFYDYSTVEEWVNSMTSTETSIDTLIAGVTGESISVTIDSNPFSLARGLILLMTDVTWLQTIFTFFMLAFAIIVILMIVKTIRALWGPIRDFIIPIIKLLPFVG